MAVCNLTDRFCYRVLERGTKHIMQVDDGPLPPKMLPTGAPALDETKPEKIIQKEPAQNMFKNFTSQQFMPSPGHSQVKQEICNDRKFHKPEPQVIPQQTVAPVPQNLIPTSIPNYASEQLANRFLCALAQQPKPEQYGYTQDVNSLFPCCKLTTSFDFIVNFLTSFSDLQICYATGLLATNNSFPSYASSGGYGTTGR